MPVTGCTDCGGDNHRLQKQLTIDWIFNMLVIVTEPDCGVSGPGIHCHLLCFSDYQCLGILYDIQQGAKTFWLIIFKNTESTKLGLSHGYL